MDQPPTGKREAPRPNKQTPTDANQFSRFGSLEVAQTGLSSTGGHVANPSGNTGPCLQVHSNSTLRHVAMGQHYYCHVAIAQEAIVNVQAMWPALQGGNTIIAGLVCLCCGQHYGHSAVSQPRGRKGRRPGGQP